MYGKSTEDNIYLILSEWIGWVSWKIWQKQFGVFFDSQCR